MYELRKPSMHQSCMQSMPYVLQHKVPKKNAHKKPRTTWHSQRTQKSLLHGCAQRAYSLAVKFATENPRQLTDVRNVWRPKPCTLAEIVFRMRYRRQTKNLSNPVSRNRMHQNTLKHAGRAEEGSNCPLSVKSRWVAPTNADHSLDIRPLPAYIATTLYSDDTHWKFAMLKS